MHHENASIMSHEKLCSTGFEVRIHKWFGRLGNNIMQLANSIYVAQVTNSSLHVPVHAMLNRTSWEFTTHNATKIDRMCGSIVMHGGEAGFFYRAQCSWQHNMTSENVSSILKTQVRPYLRLSSVRASSDVDNDTVILYIRSGDIFGTNPHPGYAQPPFAFYQRVIEMNAGRHIRIVTDLERPDLVNPVIPEILKHFPNTTMYNQTITQDFSDMLTCNRIAGAMSTLFSVIHTLSSEKQCVYKPFCSRDENAYCATFPGYIAPGNWSNSEGQRKTMLTYPVDQMQFSPPMNERMMTDC